MTPEFDKAAKRLAQHDKPYYAVKIDAKKSPVFREKYNITQYPKIKLFR